MLVNRSPPSQVGHSSRTTGWGVVTHSIPQGGSASLVPDALADGHEVVVAAKGVVQSELPPHLREAGIDVEEHPPRRSRQEFLGAAACTGPTADA
jgi:hypothetical protein